MAKSSYRGDSRGKMTCQRPSLRAETSTKIWMSGLNPNYNTTPLHSARNSRIYRRNSERISLSCDWRRHFVFAVPTTGTTPSDKIAWFPANNSIDYIQMCRFMVCEKNVTLTAKFVRQQFYSIQKNFLSLCCSTCMIYTTMYTTEIPRHSSGITYHCHKKVDTQWWMHR